VTADEERVIHVVNRDKIVQVVRLADGSENFVGE